MHHELAFPTSLRDTGYPRLPPLAVRLGGPCAGISHLADTDRGADVLLRIAVSRISAERMVTALVSVVPWIGVVDAGNPNFLRCRRADHFGLDAAGAHGVLWTQCATRA